MSDYFHEHKKTPGRRSISSLQTRWGDISKETSRFFGIKAEQDRRLQSGTTEEDRMNDSLKQYLALYKSPYRFLHVWDNLKDEPRWKQHMDEGNGKAPADPNDANLTPPVRPRGRDAAKRMRTANNSEASSAALEVMQQMMDDRKQRSLSMEGWNEEQRLHAREKLAIMREQLCVQKEDVELRKFENEQRIMSIDLAQLSGPAKQYYARLQDRLANNLDIGPSGQM